MSVPLRGPANAGPGFSWLHHRTQSSSFFRATVAALASRKDIEGKLKDAVDVRVLTAHLQPGHSL